MHFFEDNIKVQAIVITMLSLLGYVVGGRNSSFLPFGLDRSLFALIFIFGGYLSNIYLNRNIRVDFKLLVLFAIIWVVEIKYGYFNMAHRNYTKVHLCVLGGLCATLILIEICKRNINKIANLHKL